MNEPKDQWPSIPYNCFIARPIRMALPQQPLEMFYPEEAMRQIHRDGLVCCCFQRPGHFSDHCFSHCEPIPVIRWLGDIQKSCASGLLSSSSETHAFEAKVTPACHSSSLWLDSNEVLATSPGPLGPTNAASLHSAQVPPDCSSQKLAQILPQRQFKCTYPGCDSLFRHRKALERHLTCHSDARPYVCWVPECHRSFKRSDNLKAHYLTHAQMGGRNRYVATLDNTSATYSPEFRGRLTLEGWPAHE